MGKDEKIDSQMKAAEELGKKLEEITAKLNKLDQDKKNAEENFKISLVHHENTIQALEQEKITSLGQITVLEENVEELKIDLDKKDQDLVKDRDHIDDLQKEL